MFRFRVRVRLGVRDKVSVRDKIRLRFEVRFRLILFICTVIIKNGNRKWLPCGILALCCNFLNKVRKVYYEGSQVNIIYQNYFNFFSVTKFAKLIVLLGYFCCMSFLSEICPCSGLVWGPWLMLFIQTILFSFRQFSELVYFIIQNFIPEFLPFWLCK